MSSQPILCVLLCIPWPGKQGQCVTHSTFLAPKTRSEVLLALGLALCWKPDGALRAVAQPCHRAVAQLCEFLQLSKQFPLLTFFSQFSKNAIVSAEHVRATGIPVTREASAGGLPLARHQNVELHAHSGAAEGTVMTSSASSSGGVCGSKESLAQLLGFLMMKPGDRSHRWLLAASLQVKKRHVSVLTAAGALLASLLSSSPREPRLQLSL